MTAASEALGFAVIGCGSAGLRRIADLAARPDLRIVAFCDADPAVRRVRSRAHPDALVTDDHERAIGAPGVDCVIVATPPALHAGMARAALAAGRHVLVEKPLATRLVDGLALVALARERRLCLHTAANHRFFPPVQAARALIAEGALGPVRRVRARIGHDGIRLASWARERALSGGGALIDNGVHLADLLAWLGLGSRRLVAVGLLDERGGGVESSGGGRLAFDDGPMVSLWASWRGRGDYLRLAAEGEAGELWLRVGAETALEVRGRVVRRLEWSGAPFRAWEQDLDGFLAEVRGEEPSAPSSGVAALMVVDALYRSAAARAPMEVLLP